MKKKKKSDPKKDNKRLTIRAGMAMKNEFFMEAAWIISVLMEMRFKKMLIQMEGKNPGAGFTLEQYLKRMKYILTKTAVMDPNEPVQVDLIDRLRTWKNQRNTIMKDMLIAHVSGSRKEHLAKEGISLLKQLNSAYKKSKTTWKAVQETQQPAEN
jgi:hypothetical protein